MKLTGLIRSQNRTGECFGRSEPKEVVDVREMIAIKLIEFGPVVRAVLGAVPPVPIAALGDQQFVVGEAPRGLRNVLRPVISPPRGEQKLPRQVVFLGSDPYIEIRVDP